MAKPRGTGTSRHRSQKTRRTRSPAEPDSGPKSAPEMACFGRRSGLSAALLHPWLKSRAGRSLFNLGPLGGRENRLAGGKIGRRACCRRITVAIQVVDTEIVLRMLVVILRDDPIVAPLRFPREGEVALVDLEGAAADPFGRAVAVELQIALRRS